MKVEELKDALIPLIDAQIPVFVWGSPGVGKSSLIKQIAKESNKEFIDLRLSLLDPTDLRGIPFFEAENKRAVWAKPEFLPDSSEQKEGILFLDEINSAPPSIQAAAYQLILDRKIGEYTLAKNYSIVAAGNYESDRGVTYHMPTPLANRFIHLSFDLDFKQWKFWAYREKIDFRIIAFLSFKPNALYTLDTKSKQKAFATPRSWVFVNDILKSELNPKHLLDVISGAIGEELASEFINYTKVMTELPDIEHILEGKEVEIPSKNTILYALCTGVTYALKEEPKTKYLDNVLEFSLLLPSEFCVMLIRDLQKEGFNVESSSEWKNWVEANKFLIA